MASSVDTFSILVKKSFAFFKANIQQVLIGAAIFGTLGAVLSTVQGQVMSTFDARLPEPMQPGGTGVLTPEEELQAWAVFLDAFPYLLLFTCLTMILYTVYSSYFYALGLDKKKDVGSLLARLPKLFFPMIGLMIWTLLRTFVWIPIIGLIPFIILAPRFALATVFLVRDGTGIRESAQKSFVQSKGYWGKIIGNNLLFMLLTIITMMVVGIVLAVLLFFVGPLFTVVREIFVLTVISVWIFFNVFLAQTITATPKKVATKK